MLVIVAALFALRSARPDCETISGSDELTLDSSRIGKPAFYCYEDAGRRLRFILARGSDGKVRSVMDACGQCYPFHKGFAANKDELICRLCGNRYPVNHMRKGKASCVPVAVPSHEEGGRVTIRSADLKKFRWLF